MKTSLQLNTSHALMPAALHDIVSPLAPYTEHLRSVLAHHRYDVPESTLCLANDTELLNASLRVVAQYTTNTLRYVFIIGIGGANLGAMAVWEALHGLPRWGSPSQPALLFADTVEPVMLERFREIIQQAARAEEIVLCFASKSGSTAETIANAAVLIETLRERWPDGPHRILAITDERSPLWRLARTEEWEAIAIPEPVGDRFSVFSPLSIVPLTLARVDVHQLLQGGRAMLDQCLRRDNIALQSAAALFSHIQHHKRIHDTFVFRPQLESFGKWYRQLAGESLGKERDRNGVVVHAGFTPTVSVGSTDLHAVGQLYLGGPHDKVTTFLTVGEDKDVQIPNNRTAAIVEHLAGEKAGTMLNALADAAMQAYAQRQLPFLSIHLPELSPFVMGELLQWKMLEVMYLAQLLHVNAFDQPNVEEYKTITKKLLAQR